MSVLFGQSPLAVALVQWPSGRIAFANPPFEALADDTNTRLTGRRLNDVWPRPTAAPFGELLQRVYQTGQYAQLPEHEMHRNERGLTRRTFHQWVAQPVEKAPSGEVWVLLQGTDITKGVEARKQGEAQADHLYYTVELNPQVPWTADANGNIDGFNERWLTLTGLTREEALGDGWMQVPHPDDRAAMVAAWTRSVQTGAPYDIEHRIRLADGTYRWMRSRATARRTAEGAVMKWYGTTEDIHDQKLAQLALAEAESFGRSVLESSPDCLKVMDTEGRLTYMNRNGLCLLEIDDFCTISNQPWWTLWPAETQPMVLASVERAQQGQESRFQAFCPTAKGTPKWWDVQVSPVRNSDGSVQRLVSASRDITTSKQAEVALQRATERAAIAQEAAGATLYEFIPQTGQVNRDTTFIAVTGYRPDELPGTLDAWGRLMHPDDAEQALASIRAGSAGGSGFALEYRIRHKQGHDVWVYDRARLLPDGQGGPARVVGMMIDITDRKQAEQALWGLEQHTRLVLDAVGIGTWNWDLHSTVTICDEQTVRLFGLADTGYAGELDRLMAVIDPADRALVQESLDRAVLAGEPYAAEFRVRHPDGTLRWLAGKGTIDYDGAGQPVLLRGINYDITERKSLEARIREQYDELENIYQNAPIGLAVVDRQFRFQRVNERLAEINGLSAAEHIGRSIAEIVPDLATQAERIFQQVFDTGQPLLNVEFTGETKARPGQERYWNESWYPLRNMQGETFAVSVVVEEITERKQAEAELQRIKSQLEITVENIPAEVYLFDREGALLFVNQDARQVLQTLLDDAYQPTDTLPVIMQKIAGKITLTAEDGAELPVQQASVSIALTTGQPHEQVIRRVHNKTGAAKWLLSKASPLLDAAGQVLMVITVETDITVAKQAEAAIRESEAQFRTFAETLPQLVWMTDANGDQRYASNQWLTYTGLPETGPDVFWNQMVHPDDQPTVGQIWAEGLLTGQPFEMEVRMLHHSGQYRWNLNRGLPIRDAAGQVERWIGFFSDVHDQKTFAQQLEAEVAQRTHELVVANMGLQRSNEYLQQFAYVASHDLQEPLRKIQSFGDILTAQYGDTLGADGQNLLARMRSAAQRMSQLVRDLLAYSRLTTRQQPFQPVALTDTIETVLSDLELTIQQTNASIHVGPLPTVVADPVQMHQLFANLLGNALKYVPPGVAPQITLTHRRVSASDLPATEIDNALALSVPHAGNRASVYHELCVIDNGIGFDEKYLERIFGMFQRLVGKSQYEGSGMGLAICKRVIDNHAGVISAHSQPGHGSTFMVYLPA